MKKIYIGADHRGYKLKKKIVQLLEAKGYKVVDVGVFDDEKPFDYPKISYKVAKAVAGSRNNLGILICMTGLGHVIAANKVCGAYAALCYNTKTAEYSRRHNNSNILVLGAKFVRPAEINKIIIAWLNAKFDGGRHLRRVKLIKKIEKGEDI